MNTINKNLFTTETSKMENYIKYIIFSIATRVHTMHVFFYKKPKIAWLKLMDHAMTTSLMVIITMNI